MNRKGSNARAPARGALEGFDRFWEAYPKKRSKGQAEKAWRKLCPNEQLVDAIVAAVERAKKSDGWKKDGGEFIPYPGKWLNAKGWEDEIVVPGEKRVSDTPPPPDWGEIGARFGLEWKRGELYNDFIDRVRAAQRDAEMEAA